MRDWVNWGEGWLEETEEDWFRTENGDETLEIPLLALICEKVGWLRTGDEEELVMVEFSDPNNEEFVKNWREALVVARAIDFGEDSRTRVLANLPIDIVAGFDSRFLGAKLKP